jgi:hypothetical protein
MLLTTMKRVALHTAALGLGFASTLAFAAPVAAQDCTWATVNQYYGPECKSWASNCTDCCLHYHLAMNVNTCLRLGDEEKGTAVKQYFTAQHKQCIQLPIKYECVGGAPQGNCNHYAWSCVTTPCD